MCYTHALFAVTNYVAEHAKTKHVSNGNSLKNSQAGDQCSKNMMTLEKKEKKRKEKRRWLRHYVGFLKSKEEVKGGVDMQSCRRVPHLAYNAGSSSADRAIHVCCVEWELVGP